MTLCYSVVELPISVGNVMSTVIPNAHPSSRHKFRVAFILQYAFLLVSILQLCYVLSANIAGGRQGGIEKHKDNVRTRIRESAKKSNGKSDRKSNRKSEPGQQQQLGQQLPGQQQQPGQQRQQPGQGECQEAVKVRRSWVLWLYRKPTAHRTIQDRLHVQPQK